MVGFREGVGERVRVGCWAGGRVGVGVGGGRSGAGAG